MSDVEFPVDFIGIYSTILQQKKRILMADSERFDNTYVNISLSKKNDDLIIIFCGIFDDRPITMGTNHRRTDIYINIEHCNKIIKMIESNYEPKLIEKEMLPYAPDPRTFRLGRTEIPLDDVPSTNLRYRSGTIMIENLKIDHFGGRIYLDGETDKHLSREQIHMGLRNYPRNNIYPNDSSYKIGNKIKVSGELIIDKNNIDIFYSYLKNYFCP